MEVSHYYGRQVLAYPCEMDNLPSEIQIIDPIEIRSTTIRCRRCNQIIKKPDAALPHHQYYCPACINLGRVSTLAKFYHLPEPNQFEIPPTVLTWQGQLSPLQKMAAQEVAASMAHHDHRLLWAVTGAGKTEMIFPGLAAAIKRGERLAIASPRVDVCLELYPRLQEAFANTKIALLHGRQPEQYHYRQLTICTTHQLLRFYQAFDNLIIDEVDAFPYASNEQLIYATHQAIKPTGGLLYLTATPGPALFKQIKKHQLEVSYLPLRYHGHLLPEIKVKRAGRWRHRLPKSLIQWIKQRLGKLEMLIFVPHVADLAYVEAIFKEQIHQARFTTVHAANPQRLEKVQAMRDHQYDFLITTTILERGVTFPKIDVAVHGADDQVFSASALVQIAGRVGRSSERPGGDVTFWVQEPAVNVKEAQRQIKQMNRRGRHYQ